MPRQPRLDAPGLLQHVMARPPRLSELQGFGYLDLKAERIISSSCRHEISEARSIISSLAIDDMPAP